MLKRTIEAIKKEADKTGKWILLYLDRDIRGLDHIEGPAETLRFFPGAVGMTCPCNNIEVVMPLRNISAANIVDASLNPHAYAEVFLKRMVCSKYCDVAVEFLDPDCLKEALEEMFGEGSVEYHEKAQNLKGYQGDTRKQKANIIVRKKYVGSASNDLGFYKKSDGTWGAYISEYDTKSHFSTAKQQQLQQNYTVKKIEKQANKMGKKCVTKKVGKKVVMQIHC